MLLIKLLKELDDLTIIPVVGSVSVSYTHLDVYKRQT